MTISTTELRRLAKLFEQGAKLTQSSAECYAESNVIENPEAKQAYKSAGDQYSAAADVVEEIRGPLFDLWMESPRTQDYIDEEDEDFDDDDDFDDENG